MKLRFQNVKVISSQDWDDFVQSVYKKPYQLQQQDGCKDRGLFEFSVPDEADEEDMHDSIPEVVNGPDMGVKFDIWLARDPAKPLNGDEDNKFGLALWWGETFIQIFKH